MSGRRLAFWGALMGGALFAVYGGEYSVFAWLELRQKERQEIAEIAQLTRTVDSLTRFAKLVENDLVTQERLARELHGMLKKGEHAFIVQEVSPKKR